MRKLLVFVVAMTVAGITAAVALSQGQTTSPNAEPSWTPAYAGPTEGAPGASDLEILRRPRGASDNPDSHQSQLLDDGAGQLSSARRVNLGDGKPSWVMPGRNRSICLLHDSLASCPPADYLHQHDVAVAVGRWGNNDFQVAGLAVDDVSSVTVELADGQSASIAVTGNAFAVEVNTIPLKLTWSGPHGPSSYLVPKIIMDPRAYLK